MPPFNRRRSPEEIRRWRRACRATVTPPLITRDDFEDESDENSSPVSRKSDMPFTFEKKRGHDDDDDDEDSDHKGHGNGMSKDMVNSSIRGQQLGNSLEPESDSELEPDVESDGELDIESDLDSDCESITAPLLSSPPPPPPPTLISSPSTTTATIRKTFTPLPPTSTTSATPLTLVPNTPAPQPTSTTSTTQQTSDLFVPVVEPTIGFPTTNSIISTLTTTPLSEITTQPRKGLGDPVTTTDTIWITALPFMQSSLAPSSTDLNFPPIYTVLPDTDPTRDQDDDGHRDKKDKDKFPPAGLDPTAEHLLIAAGAIGAFILVCFVGWIVYRALKKSKSSPFGGNNLAARLPWKRKDGTENAWANGGKFPPNEPPPMYDKGDTNSMAEAGFYNAGKVYSQGPGSVTYSATGTLPRQQQGLQSESALASIIDQYPQGDGEMMGRNEPGQAMGTPMQGSSYYSQTDPTHQTSNSYDPASRQAYRASEISSISSGFGDGEMILPQPMPASNTTGTNTTTTTAASPIVQPPPPVPTSNNAAGRFSWMSRRDERRETVYTQTSEDRPARFRSVASWVNQQTGRIRRADSRARERGEVPVMPAIPGGQINMTQQTAYR
ncbi:hypothetical protein F4810DRAFT_1287 [Camillea tinctor]|nr:hypothetical protein F4810DRAFT_1287 [Camillea tinctor]